MIEKHAAKIGNIFLFSKFWGEKEGNYGLKDFRFLFCSGELSRLIINSLCV